VPEPPEFYVVEPPQRQSATGSWEDLEDFKDWQDGLVWIFEDLIC
jgi:hypothetical protein